VIPITARTVRDLIRWAEERLGTAGVFFGHGTERALDEAAWLVGSGLGIAPGELDRHLRDRPNLAERAKIRALVEARVRTRKPAAYLLKEAWFAGLKFYVDERVLIPRSLTGEFILERFRPWVTPRRVRRALDLCTGSGCIAIALARAFPAARVDASDISLDALAVARINVERHGLTERVRLVHSNLFDALADERYDLIVSNPPYVGARELRRLPREYRHEPATALLAGEGGLAAVARILAQARAHLSAHGILVVEVGNSAALLRKRFPHVPFTWLTTASGDDSVFLLTAAQLAAQPAAFGRARRPAGQKKAAARPQRSAR
jgi:ribosomal protein L3 glutamine methyltransferase